jgi:hypothetical protein
MVNKFCVGAQTQTENFKEQQGFYDIAKYSSTKTWHKKFTLFFE